MLDRCCRYLCLTASLVVAQFLALPIGLAQADSGDSSQRAIATGAGFVWNADDGGVSLQQGNKLVLRHEFKSGSKPIVYPLVGPGGVSMTRDYPMKPKTGKGTSDHIHHRSLWMTHGEVNGIDYWMEGPKAGTIQHDKVTRMESNEQQATLATTANWIEKDGSVLLKESRVMTVSGTEVLRQIDFTIDLKAEKTPVHFGDTKEGSFGIRVPDTMAVDSKQGGTILNEHGEKDDAAWGKRSRWVDYSGPVEGRTVGITILEHPSSLHHPCRWHVRTYGLFAANPFGEYHFTGGKPTEGYTLQPGATLHLRYKVLLHEGGADKDMIEVQWKQFAEN